MIVILLIAFLTFLIIYQFFHSSIKEGLEDNTNTSTYESYDLNDSSNALILAQKNSGNIEFLKKQIDELNGIKNTVIDLSNNYVELNDEVQNLIQQQADYANQLNGGSDQPQTITGTDTSYSSTDTVQ